jgi:predicted DNA binding protein
MSAPDKPNDASISMSVIAEFRLPSLDFELGRVLASADGATVVPETLVPVDERPVPLVWVYDADDSSFARTVREHESVEEFVELERVDDGGLYAVDWSYSGDDLFDILSRHEGHVLDAKGVADWWDFEFRFRSRDSLSDFREECRESAIELEVSRVYNPTSETGSRPNGLTPRQREAITLAIEEGYYDIPRRCTTVELGEKLGISDQAVTERLRRAIVALASQHLSALDQED